MQYLSCLLNFVRCGRGQVVMALDKSVFLTQFADTYKYLNQSLRRVFLRLLASFYSF